MARSARESRGRPGLRGDAGDGTTASVSDGWGRDIFVLPEKVSLRQQVGLSRPGARREEEVGDGGGEQDHDPPDAEPTRESGDERLLGVRDERRAVAAQRAGRLE